MDIEKEVTCLLPELHKQIEDALPAEFHQAFDAYIFLTLFHALKEHTPAGDAEAKKLITAHKWTAGAIQNRGSQ